MIIHDNSPLRGFQSQIAINPSGSRRSGLSCQTKAMEGSSEPAKPWFSVIKSDPTDYTIIIHNIYIPQGRAILGHDQFHSQQNCNSKGNHKTGYLIHDLIRSCVTPYYVRPCSSSAWLYQSLSYTSSIDKFHSWVAPISHSMELPWNHFLHCIYLQGCLGL